MAAATVHASTTSAEVDSEADSLKFEPRSPGRSRMNTYCTLRVRGGN